MPNGTQRRRRTSQKGVQAIFTPRSDRKGRVELAVGALSVAVGFSLLVLVAQSPGGAVGAALKLGDVAAWPMLVPTSFLLVAGGAGLCTYFFVVRRTRQEYYRLEFTLNRLESLIGSKDDSANGPVTIGPDSKPSTKRGLRVSKSFVTAVVEGILLLLLYTWLVAEYGSNVYMQGWVRARISWGDFLFSESAVVLLGAVMLTVLVLGWVRSRSTLKPFREE